MKYQAALFDADDTLFDFPVCERLALERLFRELDIVDPEGADRYHWINERCWKALERGEMSREELKVGRFRELLKPYGRAFDIPDVAFRYEMALSEQAQLLPGALEAVKRVAERMPVAIVTNGIARVQRGRMAISPLTPYVSALMISEEVGASKPDPKMIFAALEALGGVPAERALLIGDSLSSDMTAAARAGVDACWVNPDGVKNDRGIPVRYEVRSVLEAVPIILS